MIVWITHVKVGHRQTPHSKALMLTHQGFNHFSAKQAANSKAAVCKSRRPVNSKSVRHTAQAAKKSISFLIIQNSNLSIHMPIHACCNRIKTIKAHNNHHQRPVNRKMAFTGRLLRSWVHSQDRQMAYEDGAAVLRLCAGWVFYLAVWVCLRCRQVLCVQQLFDVVLMHGCGIGVLRSGL